VEQRFDKVTLERTAPEGRVVVDRGLDLPFGQILFALSVAHIVSSGVVVQLCRNNLDAQIGLIMLGGMVPLMALLVGFENAIARRLATPVRKLEVYLDAGVDSEDYRVASKPRELRLRTRRRDVPLDPVRNVTRTSEHMTPKNDSWYWRYGAYVVLEDEVLEIATFDRDEGKADAPGVGAGSSGRRSGRRPRVHYGDQGRTSQVVPRAGAARG
jgi:hypothetical protein